MLCHCFRELVVEASSRVYVEIDLLVVALLPARNLAHVAIPRFPKG